MNHLLMDYYYTGAQLDFKDTRDIRKSQFMDLLWDMYSKLCGILHCNGQYSEWKPNTPG